MKLLKLTALAALALVQAPAPVSAAEGCVRPLGGPCISAPRSPVSVQRICKTRTGSCKVDLPAGATCRCKGIKGVVQS
jgi:hypothetical protein